MSDVLNTEHGVFTSNPLTGQSAEEVYQEWLENRDKIDICPVNVKTNEELQAENEELRREIDNLSLAIIEMYDLILQEDAEEE